MSDRDISQALARLDALTRQLRLECPWDREQDERSIVPHTLEEAYELADAAHARDDAKLIDELGDVLFQVHFLALLLEERGAGNLAEVADHCRRKLISRHPHVFGVAEAPEARPEVDRAAPEVELELSPRTSAEVLRNWDVIKSTEPGRQHGVFGEVPENLPALLYARKVQRRAASAGRTASEGILGSVGTLREELGRLEATIAGEPLTAPVESEHRGVSPSEGESARPQAFEELGDVLFAMVTLARECKLDPELALRAAAQRFRDRFSEENT